jgi:hypothetical protein
MNINRRAFLQKSFASCTVAFQGESILRAIDRSTSIPGLLQARGREIVAKGRAIRLRGVNLGGWMLIEDYMIAPLPVNVNHCVPRSRRWRRSLLYALDDPACLC